MISLGIDLVQVDRLKRAIKKNRNFLSRVFTEAEIKHCLQQSRKYEHLAGRFAVKEAVAKAFNISPRWREIETLNDRNGKPKVNLYGKLEKIGHDREILLSISHTREYAIAQVIVLEQQILSGSERSLDRS